MADVDTMGVVQQVQGIVEGYVRLRDEKAALENKVFQLNQDIKRMQANAAELIKENERLKSQDCDKASADPAV